MRQRIKTWPLVLAASIFYVEAGAFSAQASSATARQIEIQEWMSRITGVEELLEIETCVQHTKKRIVNYQVRIAENAREQNICLEKRMEKNKEKLSYELFLQNILQLHGMEWEQKGKARKIWLCTQDGITLFAGDFDVGSKRESKRFYGQILDRSKGAAAVLEEIIKITAPILLPSEDLDSSCGEELDAMFTDFTPFGTRGLDKRAAQKRVRTHKGTCEYQNKVPPGSPHQKRWHKSHHDWSKP